MKKLIDEYAEKCISNNMSFSAAAKKLLKNNPEVTLSHRTIRKSIAAAVKEKKKVDMNEKLEIEETEDVKNYKYEGNTCITSKEEAIKFFNIDSKKEKIIRWSYRAWDVTMKVKNIPVKRTNYMVRVDTEVNTSPFDYKKVEQDIDKFFDKKRVTPVKEGKDVIMVSIADIHVGAKTTKSKGVINTKNYSLEHLINYLNKIADKVNSQNKQEVHLSILGDLVESITGLNHLNSWQGMEEDVFGANALIIAEQILGRFLERINNLEKVYIVSGNHDRLHPNKEVNDKGDAAKIVAYMLSKNFKVVYHPLVISTKLDGIGYVLYHGDKGISKQNLSKIILDYGFKNCYNVCVSGHLHSRNTKREFYKVDHVIQDSSKYRGVVLAPLFTGNYYSESSGWTSSAGYSQIEANEDKTNITHTDVGL